MILTCPNCEFRFTLPAQALAPEGRKVRCSKCQEVWHQLPDPDELIEDLEDGLEEGVDEEAPAEAEAEQSFEEILEEESQDGDEEQDSEEEPEGEDSSDEEDIPDAVKPLPEDAPENAQEEPQGKAPFLTKKSIAIGAVAGLLLFSPFFFLKGTLTSSWPESMAFYKMFGLIDTMPGEGLVFDQLKTMVEGESVTVTGQIINLTSSDKPLPLIEVAARDSQGETLSKWVIKLPESVLQAEGVIPLKASHDMPDIDKASDLRVGFVLKVPNF